MIWNILFDPQCSDHLHVLTFGEIGCYMLTGIAWAAVLLVCSLLIGAAYYFIAIRDRSY